MLKENILVPEKITISMKSFLKNTDKMLLILCL